MTEGKRVNAALELVHKFILLSIPHECNLLSPGFLIWMRKKLQFPGQCLSMYLSEVGSSTLANILH